MDPLSVLVYVVGAMDVIEVLMYFVAHLRGDQLRSEDDIDDLKDRIRRKIEAARVPSDPRLTSAADGTLFKDGFRVGEIDQKGLDEVSKKVDELIDRIEINDVSPAKASSSDINKVFIEKESESEAAAHTLDESKLRPIARDDELRHVRPIRTSTSSASSHVSRTEELQALTALELEEQSKDDGYVPISYEGDNLSDDDVLETIPEGSSNGSAELDREHSQNRENVEEWLQRSSEESDQVVKESSPVKEPKTEDVKEDSLAKGPDQEDIKEPVILIKRVNLIGTKPEV